MHVWALSPFVALPAVEVVAQHLPAAIFLLNGQGWLRASAAAVEGPHHGRAVLLLALEVDGRADDLDEVGVGFVRVRLGLSLVVPDLGRQEVGLLDLLVEEDLEVAVWLGLALSLDLVLPERQEGFDLRVARVGDVHEVAHVVERAAVLVQGVLL